MRNVIRSADSWLSLHNIAPLEVTSIKLSKPNPTNDTDPAIAPAVIEIIASNEL